MKIFTIKNKWTTLFKKFLIIVFWLLVWQAAYIYINKELLVPSPKSVIIRLIYLFKEWSFWNASILSILRILLGFLLSAIIGTFLAVASTKIKFVYDFISPLINIIKVTPIASFIILALVFIKSSYISIFICFLMVLPIFFVNIIKGINKTDKSLLQMGKSFNLSKIDMLKKIYIPSVIPYFTASCITGLGFAWKAGISAEVISNLKKSIGGSIYRSKIYLDTVDLFAWTLTVILFSVILEFIIMKLMNLFFKKYKL